MINKLEPLISVNGFDVYLFVNLFILLIGISRQCFSCRSRGEKGFCKDSFPYNETTSVGQPGIKIVPCPSGWCSKVIEGIRGPQEGNNDASKHYYYDLYCSISAFTFGRLWNCNFTKLSTISTFGQRRTMC